MLQHAHMLCRLQISRIVWGAALAQANAIMTGWRIGAKEFEECNRGTRKAAIYGIITATCFSVTFALTGHFIVHIFTDDTQMINLVVKVVNSRYIS